MPTLFIDDEQHLVCSEEDFEKLVDKYMGDDAITYLSNNYHGNSNLDDLKEVFIEEYLENLEIDPKLDEVIELLEKCWNYLRENYQHETEIGEEIRVFIDGVNS